MTIRVSSKSQLNSESKQVELIELKWQLFKKIFECAQKQLTPQSKIKGRKENDKYKYIIKENTEIIAYTPTISRRAFSITHRQAHTYIHTQPSRFTKFKKMKVNYFCFVQDVKQELHYCLKDIF